MVVSGRRTQFPYVAVALGILALAGELCADPPRLLTREEVITRLREKAPFPRQAVGLFELLTRPESPTSEGPVDGEGPRPNTALQLMSRIPEVSLAPLRTGDHEADADIAGQLQKNVVMVWQAVLHLSLHDFPLPDGPEVSFQPVDELLKRVNERKEMSDEVFWPLNREFLEHWSLQQYRAEFGRTLRAAFEAAVTNLSPENAAREFKRIATLVPVETRKRVYSLSKDREIAFRLFLGAQDDVLIAIVPDYLPHFLPLYRQEDFDLALWIVVRHMRVPEITVPVVQWCLNHARNYRDLLRLLANEVWDAAFCRFRKQKTFFNGQYNPYQLLKAENVPNADPEHAEEEYFHQYFLIGTEVARQRFGVDPELFLSLLGRRIAGNRDRGAESVLETLLFHIERGFSYPSLLDAWDRPLQEIQKTVLDAKADSSIGKWREAALEKIRDLRQELVIRKRGWFPPRPESLREIIRVLREGMVGPHSEDETNELTLGAARIALPHGTAQLIDNLTLNLEASSALWRSPDKLLRLERCLGELILLNDQAPQDEPQA